MFYVKLQLCEATPPERGWAARGEPPHDQVKVYFEMFLHPFMDCVYTFTGPAPRLGERLLRGFQYHPHEDHAFFRRGERLVIHSENIPRGANMKLVNAEALRQLLEELAEGVPEEFRARIDWLLYVLGLRALT